MENNNQPIIPSQFSANNSVPIQPKKSKKLLILIALIVVVLIVGGGWFAWRSQIIKNAPKCGGFAGLGCPVGYKCTGLEKYPDAMGYCEKIDKKDLGKEELVTYKNFDYGFIFSLPQSWTGYKIISDKWEGYDLTKQSPSGQVIAETGPIISIRNPKWTEQNPYQDIPIMVFTIEQWNDLQVDKFHIGAAPINPSEIFNNGIYVFALPARYNFAYPEGYEEVEQIINSQPMRLLGV